MTRISCEKLIFERSLARSRRINPNHLDGPNGQTPKTGLSSRYREWYTWYRANWFVRGRIIGLPDESPEVQSTPTPESDITLRQYYNCTWRSDGDRARAITSALFRRREDLWDSWRAAKKRSWRPPARSDPAITRDSRNRKTKRTPSARACLSLFSYARNPIVGG